MPLEIRNQDTFDIPPLLTVLSLSHINRLLFHFSTVPKERQFTLLKSSSCIVVAVAICPGESGITIVMAR